ncbi:hypothetical protein M9H77_30781 [Catharanthus roseus]|uniref:Uncharacterized protein n=1 Tax=Catharanthus roseus TaxID=4058 RepID=A0ACC0A094_CATRO|nr:hypothetical protein M9H77_30781 [Catharanthus roseus]
MLLLLHLFIRIFKFKFQLFIYMASSDGVDDLDSGEWIHLKRGVDRGGCGPIGLRRHRIMLCGGVQPSSEESGGTRHRALLGFLHSGVEAALMCLDSLRLLSCTRNPYYGSSTSICCPGVGLSFFFLGTYSLVPRGTQIPYSTAVDLVAGLGVSHVVSERLGTRWHTTFVDGYIWRVHFETVDGLVVQGVEPGVSIEEDSNEAESDAGMLPKPERVAPVDAEGVDTLVAGESPVALSPICGYCLWSGQQVEATGQQISELREEILRVDALVQVREAHAAREREIQELVDERD